MESASIGPVSPSMAQRNSMNYETRMQVGDLLYAAQVVFFKLSSTVLKTKEKSVNCILWSLKPRAQLRSFTASLLFYPKVATFVKIACKPSYQIPLSPLYIYTVNLWLEPKQTRLPTCTEGEEGARPGEREAAM